MIDRFEQFCSSISGIYKSIQKIKRDEMARYGLKGPHAQCLITLHRRQGGVTFGQLCEACELDKAAVSRVVAELEEKGMIEREAGDKLYRAPLHLTPSGTEIALRISGIAEKAVEIAGGGIGEGERAAMYQALGQIAAQLQRICREGLPGEHMKGNNEIE